MHNIGARSQTPSCLQVERLAVNARPWHTDHKNPFLPTGYEIKAYTYSGQHADHKKSPSCLQEGGVHQGSNSAQMRCKDSSYSASEEL